MINFYSELKFKIQNHNANFSIIIDKRLKPNKFYDEDKIVFTEIITEARHRLIYGFVDFSSEGINDNNWARLADLIVNTNKTYTYMIRDKEINNGGFIIIFTEEKISLSNIKDIRNSLIENEVIDIFEIFDTITFIGPDSWKGTANVFKEFIQTVYTEAREEAFSKDFIEYKHIQSEIRRKNKVLIKYENEISELTKNQKALYDKLSPEEKLLIEGDT